MAGPDAAFWQQRFERGETPWDRGASSPQLATWLAEGALRPGRIAVPGCGSGHEIETLARAGFSVTGLDYAAAAISITRQRLARAGLSADVHHADVLAWLPVTPLDMAYEQTCLCALHPDHWSAYAERLRRWLRPGGTLAVLAMQARREGAGEGRIEGPPYHVDINALRALLPASHWDWSAPPYACVPHPAQGWFELGLLLRRRSGSV
ncbi:methyltransferase domain-containing protein [Methylibium sp.]|uniref:methyltransferase domain-containing protein n=1 Tax=Methylibium sp. TaxID=2067992 RepID=UPI00286C001E|nr:methyltransferase domain-containing protein [Methylibium sp.]